MTRIDFYRFVPSKLAFACRLARKAYASQAKTGQKLVILCPEQQLDEVDRELWRFSALDFIPHSKVGTPQAPLSAVLLTADAAASSETDVLLNLTDTVPDHFARYERLLEIVPQDEAGKEQARERYRFYRERGYQLATHDVESA